MKKINAKSFAVLLATTVIALPAYAQNVPSSAEPGVIMRGFENEKREPSRLEDTVSAPKEESAGKGLSTAKAFTLKAVVLDKTTVYKDVDLTSVFKDMIGQEVSFADLNVIAQRMTRKYREDGYVFSRAVLPPQKVNNGVVHLQAVEGRIANVKVVGHYEDKNGLIQSLADRINTSDAANTNEIERYLLLIDDLPGITARSFIKPSATKGGGDLIIDVEEDPFEGSVSVDDRGSRYLGPYRGTLVGAFNNTLGLHDRTTLRGIAAAQVQELAFADITHEEQLGKDGAKVTFRGAVTKSQPGGNISTLGIEGDSQMFDTEAVYPLLRSRQYNWNLLGGLNVLHSTTDVSGVQTAEDSVRTARLGTHVDFTDALRGVNQFDFVATKGLGIWGASEEGTGRSRANAVRNFLKGNLTATRVQQLPDRFSVMVSGTGQVSSHALLASEEFAVGGPSFGRAYDAGEITGDAGWAGVTELRYGGPVDNSFIQSYQAYTYIDYGRISNHAAVVGESEEDSVTSAGVGVRFNVQNDVSGYVELDKPMNQAVASEGDDGSRLFFSLLKRF